jgi:hypothetical protein
MTTNVLRPELHVVCPKCDAPIGRRCRSRTGKVVKDTHRERGDAFSTLPLARQRELWRAYDQWVATGPGDRLRVHVNDPGPR